MAMVNQWAQNALVVSASSIPNNQQLQLIRQRCFHAVTAFVCALRTCDCTLDDVTAPPMTSSISCRRAVWQYTL